MPRQANHTKDSLARSAMAVFWQSGYASTSMDDLVRATGVSRHGIYKAFGGKQALFAGAFPVYQQEVVTPAFHPVEHDEARLSDVAAYFEFQIARAESLVLPGPGCLVANTMTEKIGQNAAIAVCVSKHLERLKSGFGRALENEGCSATDVGTFSRMMVTFTQGLWSESRVTANANSLRQSVDAFLTLVAQSIK